MTELEWRYNNVYTNEYEYHMTFNFKSHTDKRRHDANLAEKYDFQDFWETWDLGAKKKKIGSQKKDKGKKVSRNS